MVFTANSDLYAAIDEDGINLVVGHMMGQRPSLFNYGTALFAEFPELFCHPIEPTSMVKERDNPFFSREKPFILPGTNDNLALDFCIQLTALAVDFHPGDVIALPPELEPPLDRQTLAIRVEVCAGVGCPTQEFLDTYELPKPADEKEDRPRPKDPKNEEDREPPTIVPSDGIECFCLALVLVAEFKPAGETLDKLIQPRVVGIEFVDLKPEGLENIIECILHLMIQIVVLPKVAEALEEAVKAPLAQVKDLAGVTLVPTPTPADVPHNPAVEDDQTKVFINIEKVEDDA